MESEDKYSRLLKKAQEINLDQEEIPENENERENKINKKTIIKKKDKDDLDEVPKMLKKKKILKKADNRLRAVKRKQKKNYADFLMKIICFQYFLVFWKKKSIAMKYSTTGYNKKRVAFKKFYAKIRDIYYKKKIESDAEIFEILLNLPERPGVIHDKNFNKLKLVNNEVLIEKYENLIEEMSIKNVGLKIKNILVESMNSNKNNNNKKNNVINIESNKKNEIDLNEDDLKDSYKEIKLKGAKKEINKKLVEPESKKDEITNNKNHVEKDELDEKIEQNKKEIKEDKKDEIKKVKKEEKKDEKIELNKMEIKDEKIEDKKEEKKVEKKEDLNDVDTMENKLKKVFKETFGS